MRISRAYLKTALLTQVKLHLALRAAFFLKLAAIVVKHGLFIVMWAFFFETYETVNGWCFTEMLALYGLVSFGIGVVEAIFYGVRDLPFLIDTNQIDNYLVQPKNVLLNVALSKGDASAFAEAIYGLVLLLISGYLVHDALWLACLLPVSVLFIFSLYLYLSSVAFFLKNSQGFIRDLYQNANIVATQPNAAYYGVLKLMTLTLLPTAYLSFFPIEFLRTHNVMHVVYAYGGSALFFLLACSLFYKGLRRYESSSLISHKF